MKKVILDYTLDNFDLWQTFQNLDELEELKIDSYGLRPVLSDSKTQIRPLIKLKKIKIRCQYFGFYFFIEVTEFSPNIEILKIYVIKPRHQLTNHSLTALSECKQLKELDLSFQQFSADNWQTIIDPDVDDIGIVHLLENCEGIKRIGLHF